MPRIFPRVAWLAPLLAFFLYFFRLGGAGLLGPDEPRYAWIGRAMAQSGDWVTPRLWGQPWFEKPALLYWMIAGAFRVGFGPDLAPRLPVALLGAAFLGFYWWILNREFGCRAATFAAVILGSSVAWIGFSNAAVPDLPMTAMFSAAMLLALPWVAKRDPRFLPMASLMLGLAVLAKGLVPLALAAPLALRLRWFRDLLRPRVLLPALVVSAPWYIACYLQNGPSFLNEFFIRHHFGRFTSGELLHTQPWWFYLARMPLLVLPWAPLLLLVLQRRSWYAEPRRRFLVAWLVFGLILFSASANKLPGYILPLLPALAVIVALSLEELADARQWLTPCAALLLAFPVAAPMLPAALANEWSAAPRPAFHWTWLTPAIPAVAVWYLETRRRRVAAVAVIAAATTVGVVYLKLKAEPELERLATARALAREAARHAGDLCAGDLKRDWEYGLTYYLGARLPSCEVKPSHYQVLQDPGQPPRVVSSGPGSGTASIRRPIDPDVATLYPHVFQDTR